MSPGDLSIAAAGAALVFLAVRDVLLALAHLDRNGPIGAAVQHVVWRGARALGERWPGRRRELCAAAGPLMLVVTIGTWAACYMVGFALVVWPHLPGGFVHMQGGPMAGTFSEALYFSGTAGTTLGFGDIAPTNGFTRLLAVGEALLGLAMLTGVVSYLLNCTGAAVDRNLATLTIHEEAGAQEDGVGFVIRVVGEEGEAALGMRLDTITATLRAYYVRAYHYPMVHLYYRSNDPAFDPEPALRTALEAAIAGHLVGARAEARTARASAMHLGRILTRLMRLVAAGFMPPAVRHAIAHPTPGEADRALIAAVRARLRAELPAEDMPATYDEAALALASQGRTFLEALDGLTRWRRDHPRPEGLVGLP